MTCRGAGVPRRQIRFDRRRGEPARAVGRLGRLLVAGALSIMPLLARTGPVWAQQTPDPPRDSKSPTFTGLAGAPEANLFAGGATTSIPIDVPPGRGKIAPRLALGYSSAAGPGPYGYGWDLRLGRIRRSTKRGVLTCAKAYRSDEFVLVLPEESVEFREDGTGEYAARFEESFLRIRHLEPSNSWEVWDRGGLRYRFGETDEARSGNDPGVAYDGSSCAAPAAYAPAYTFAWELTSIEDTNGNRLDIEYEKEEGTSYPVRVLYGGNAKAGQPHLFEVAFAWRDRPRDDEIVNGTGGFPARLTRLLQSVQVRHPVGGPRVRWYGLDYQFAIGPERLGRQSFLAAVTVYDDRDRALARWDGQPASSTFLYHQNEPAQGRFGFSETVQNAPNGLERLRGWRADLHDVDTWGDIFDINGDGIPDRIDSYVVGTDCNAGPGAWTVHLGGPRGFDAAPVSWTVPDKSVLCYIRWEQTPGDLRWTVRDTVDLTGDGVPDYVDTTPGDAGIWHVYAGYATASGGGFRDPPIEWPAPGANLRGSRANTQWLDLGFGGSVTIDTRDLIDLDGDGLLDLVQAPDGDSTRPWSVWINTGQGFDTVARRFPAPFGVLGFRKESDEILALRDMNGDGLPDLVVAWNKLSHPGIPDFWEVYLHEGLGIDSTPETWPVPRDRYDSSRPIGDRWSLGFSSQSNVYRAIMDMNGDGLPDLVDVGGWTEADPFWQVVLNRGDGLAPDVLSWAAPDHAPGTGGSPPPLIREGGSTAVYVDTFDIDGDGLPDYVSDASYHYPNVRIWHDTGGAWCPSADGIDCSDEPSADAVAADPEGTRPDLLEQMENGLGGTTVLEYRPSTQWDNGGSGGAPGLPLLLWTLTRIERDDGMCDAEGSGCASGGSHVTAREFAYRGGLFDPFDREFRGFLWAETEEQAAAGRPHLLTATLFHQERPFAGKVHATWDLEALDDIDPWTRPLRRVVNYWSCADRDTGQQTYCADGSWVRLDGTYETTASDYVLRGRTRDTINSEWDRCNGKVFGNVAHAETGETGGARTHVHTEYACVDDGERYVVDRPTHVVTKDATNAITLQEQWFYYDGGPLGFVEEGNLTRSESWLDHWIVAPGACAADSGRACVRTSMTYDPFGNLTQVTDALGRTTSTTYDSATHIYPYVVTGPSPLLLKTGTAYDPGCGKLLWKTITYPATGSSPEAQPRTEQRYDAFCRLVRRTLPYDGPYALADEYYEYVLGGPRRPSAVVRTFRGTDSSPFGYNTEATLADALGRIVEKKEPAVVDGVLTNAVVATEYDERGRPRAHYVPFADGAPGDVYAAVPVGTGRSVTDYDGLGRPVRVTHPDGTYQEMILSTAWETTTRDECYTSRECTGAQVVEKRDALDRVVEKLVLEEDALKTRTRFTYDALGRLLATEQGDDIVWNPATRVEIGYDSLGRKIATSDPDSGEWRYEYDAAGNLIYQNDPRPNQHLEFCYDGLGRVRRKSYLAGDAFRGPDPSCTRSAARQITYTYDQGGLYDFGRLVRVDDLAGASLFDYDVRGRAQRVERTIEVDGAVTTAAVSYAYDEGDHLTSVTYPDGEVVTYQYDAAGRLSGVDGDLPYLTGLTYDVFGRPRAIRHGNDTTDERVYSPDPGKAYRLQSVRTTDFAGNLLLDYDYTDYAPTGLLRRVVDRAPLGDGGATDNSAGYFYDGLGRLVTAAGPKIGTRYYDYDAFGNMTLKGAVFMTYDVARPHQLVKLDSATENVTYDANGNRTGKPGETYSFDEDDHLTRIEVEADVVEFRYGYDGRRVAKLVNGETTRYYSDLFEADDRGWATKYYFAGETLIASRRQWAPQFAAAGEPAMHLAAVSLGRPALLLLVRRDIRHGAALGLGLLGAVLFFAPWRRRRIVGIRVRHGHVLLVVLAFAVGTTPWPLAMRPAQAQCHPMPTPTPVADPQVAHYHLDQRGCVQLVTGPAGTVLEHVRYLPYGGIRGRYDASGAPIPAGEFLRHEFAGYETEAVSGLQYAGARFYDPEVGAFLTHDPAWQFGSPFSYGDGDPINWSDPNGEFFAELFVSLVVAATISAAFDVVVAAIQGASLSQIGKAALGGAITGAVGVGLGVVVSGANIALAGVSGSLPAGVGFSDALDALGQVAYRSAFSTVLANAAGQTAGAAGAPPGLVIAASFAGGYAGSVLYDQYFIDPSAASAQRAGQDGVQRVSNRATHEQVTLDRARAAGFSDDEVERILRANLDEDTHPWMNADHFDFASQRAFQSFKDRALQELSPNQAVPGPGFFDAVGRASHHLQDPYALGHIFPGTHLFRGPVGAPLRFLIHQTFGGEVTFFNAQSRATLRFFESIRSTQAL